MRVTKASYDLLSTIRPAIEALVEGVVQKTAATLGQVDLADYGEAGVEEVVGRHGDAGGDLDLDQAGATVGLRGELTQAAALVAGAGLN